MKPTRANSAVLFTVTTVISCVSRMSLIWFTELSLVCPSWPSWTWAEDCPAHCELHTPLVCEISGRVVMKRLGSSVASAPTHGVSKCLAVLSELCSLDVSVWMTAASARTVTSEPTAPSSKVTLTRRTWLPSRMMLSATKVLKPAAVTLRRYRPRIRSGISKSPLSLVASSRF